MLIEKPSANLIKQAQDHAKAARAENREATRRGARGCPVPIEPAAIIGSGTMGRGIALSLALKGISVSLHDIDKAALENARSGVDRMISSLLKRERISATEAAAIGRSIDYRHGFDGVGEANLAIEAVVEKLNVKREVFATLDSETSADAILATNTSYLDVREIGEATGRPDDVIGLHFFAPAHIMKLLEIVLPLGVSNRARSAAFALSERLDKVGIVAGNSYGFIGNRIMQAYIRQAHLMLREGASPLEVDGALEAFGMPIGPIRLGDMSGLDVGYNARKARTLTEEEKTAFGIADALVEMGRTGMKVGGGFYDYTDGNRQPIPSGEVEDVIASLRLDTRKFEPEMIAARCLFALVNEGFRVLDEGVADGESSIDLVYLHGYGFPADRGGPMWWARHQVGLEHIAKQLAEFEATTGCQSLAPHLPAVS